MPSDPPNYHLVYDIWHSFPAGVVLIAIPVLLFAVFGGLAFRDFRRGRWANVRVSRIGAAAMLLGGVAFVLILATAGRSEIAMRIAVIRHHYRVVEGVITDFVPGDPGDHVEERWTVRTPSGVYSYSYSPHNLGEPGYNQTAPNGGLVRNGLRVRLFDVNGHIARLELAR